MPGPKELDDLQLPAKQWEMIRGLAMLDMFLCCTDHLSDRKLYEELWYRVFREENLVMQDNGDSAWHIDLVGGGGKEDIESYLRYYADEETRCQWAKDWPTDVMPAHGIPPYDRDRQTREQYCQPQSLSH